MSDKMEWVLLWWAECVAALVKGLEGEHRDGSKAAVERFTGAVGLVKEGQDLAARATRRFEDLAPLMAAGDEPRQTCRR